MKHSSAELKAMARGSLCGRYTQAAELVILYLILSSMLGYIAVFLFPSTGGYSFINLIGNFMVSLLTMMLSAGLLYCFLAISRGWQIRTSDLFVAFRFQSDKALLLSLISSAVTTILYMPLSLLLTFVTIFPDYLARHTFLALLLSFLAFVCLILHVLFVLSFSMCYYIYLDHAELSTIQIIQHSFRMIRGNRIRLFYLSFSFIGLLLLSVLTCFIGLLWIIPYMETTAAMFYRELNGELS